MKKLNKPGSALLISIFLIAVFGTAAMGISKIVITEIRSNRLASDGKVAYYAAEAGIEDGLARYRNNPDIILETTDHKPKGPFYLNPDEGTLRANYQLRIWRNEPPETGDVLNSSTYLKKDEIRQLDVSNLAGQSITLYWTRPLYDIRNTPLDTNDDKTKSGNQTILQWQLINGNSTSPNTQVIKEGGNGASIADRRGPFLAKLDDTISIPAGNNLKLKLHAYVVHDGSTGDNGAIVKYLFKDAGIDPNSSLTIDTGFTTIEAIGNFGDTTRKVQVKIDNTTRRAIGLFDYSLFIGGGGL